MIRLQQWIRGHWAGARSCYRFRSRYRRPTKQDGQTKRKEKRDGTFSSISATASDKIGTQEMAEREKETGHKKKGTAFFVVGMRLALM